jgi:hypothetical protein
MLDLSNRDEDIAYLRLRAAGAGAIFLWWPAESL